MTQQEQMASAKMNADLASQTADIARDPFVNQERREETFLSGDIAYSKISRDEFKKNAVPFLLEALKNVDL